MINVNFILRNGEKRSLQAATGQSLMLVAKANDIDIEGACGGAMACATCHVIVDAGWADRLPAPLVDETDMLDLAPGLTKTSRLACQIALTDKLDGLIVKLPNQRP